VVFAVFQWLERTSLSVAINESLWAFAVVEAIHLVALAVIGGAVLVVDLRLLGLAFQERRVGEVARVAQPWFVWSLVAMLSTGSSRWRRRSTTCTTISGSRCTSWRGPCSSVS
jgi:hypothetical protein